MLEIRIAITLGSEPTSADSGMLEKFLVLSAGYMCVQFVKIHRATHIDVSLYIYVILQ